MEAIALIADIHANLLAAEAVLSDIHKKHRPDRIISLGDQVNLGPAPRDTLRLLRSENVTCLHGNHEGYILSAMNNDPRYAGANFASLRFNASLLKPDEITFQKSLSYSGVTFCHARRKMTAFPCLTRRLRFPACKKKTMRPTRASSAATDTTLCITVAKFNARRDRQYGLHG